MSWIEPAIIKDKDNKFEIVGETMYGGQGKNRPIIINQRDISDHISETKLEEEDQTIQDKEIVYDGLHQPLLNESKEVIKGHNKTKMRKENKQRRQEKRAS